MIPVSEPYIGEEEIRNVAEALRSTWISSAGKYLDEFEHRFAAYCGVKHGIATTSGTTALHLALAALRVGKEDEVVVPAFTNIATANAVIYTGAKPVFVDSEAETWNMDTEQLKEKITKKTKAIIPVHIFGHPADMGPIMDVASDRNIFVVEDAAEAHGAEYKGKKVGSIGHINAFSFYGNKLLTTGEGGMVMTNDDDLEERCRGLKNVFFDKARTYIHQEVGFSYRMTNLAAAIGVAQLDRLEWTIEKKRRMAFLYESYFKRIEGIRLQKIQEWAKSVHWMYPLVLEDSFGIERDEAMRKLYERGIETRRLFGPMNRQPAFKDLQIDYDCPVAEDLYARGFYLPSSVKLTEEQIKYVAETLIGLKRA